MKKIITLLLLANLSLAQESTDPKHRYLGLGFKLGAFQTSELYGSLYPVNRLFLSVDPIKYLRVDVQWGINNRTEEQIASYPNGTTQSFDLEEKSSILQFGIFGTFNLDDLLLFGGIRYGISKGSDEYLNSNWNGQTIEYSILSNNRKGNSLAPVIGAEYRFGNRFSVGAEISYLIMNETFTPGTTGAVPLDNKLNLTETSAFFRFFPF